jgi:ABC-type transport system involved in cytochrome bd biosynthesis fused ATPase/permease subunit
VRRSFLAPEVIQSSGMDCGPASLKCVLEGFGKSVSYGRLREACQTDVDGTSIDTLEEVASQLGLGAEQWLVPIDYLLLPGAATLPSIVTVRLPNGAAHFVVLWSQLGPLVQIMDPASGRRWMSARRLLADLYVHESVVEEAAFREYATSAPVLQALERRLARLGVGGADRRVREAAAAASFRPLAELEAVGRMVEAICGSGGLARGRASARVCESFLERLRDDPLEGPPESWPVPQMFWTAWRAPGSGLRVRGAVLVAVAGPRAGAAPPTSPELAEALRAPPPRPLRTLGALAFADGLWAPAALAAALALTAFGIVVLGVLFKALLEAGPLIGLREQRLAAAAALASFVLTLLLLEAPTALGALWFGRRLEARLRVAFLHKLPRLGDRYLQSRLTSDMAERCHVAHRLRQIPDLLCRFARFALELGMTTAGIVWLDPAGAPWALAACALSVAVPLATQSPLHERDMRMRSHAGALTRFYLDALLGLVAIRTHGAERSVRREHEGLLVEWARAARSLLRAAAVVEALNMLAAYGLAAALVTGHVARAGDAPGALLMLFWALNLPALGQELALLARQFPGQRSVALRLLEPLGALAEAEGASDEPAASETAAAGPAELHLEGVHVVASGQSILRGVDLRLDPGEHVAVVGPSGAGKSSLLGLLLGWHRPAAGQLLVDGGPLAGARLQRLRERTAWVDPAVQLWNRSLFDNLAYGANDPSGLGRVVERADLTSLVGTLPEGLQTVLGDGGALVSGGEGQRVRLGRAMLREHPRLVLLDEPFRGLDRERRKALLTAAREVWASTTLLCVTHDVAETLAFPRVLVVEAGRVVEDGPPGQLAAREHSRYRALLEAERDVVRSLWSGATWRRLRVRAGRLAEEHSP